MCPSFPWIAHWISSVHPFLLLLPIATFLLFEKLPSLPDARVSFVQRVVPLRPIDPSQRFEMQLAQESIHVRLRVPQLERLQQLVDYQLGNSLVGKLFDANREHRLRQPGVLV
jgi:hypothetical protein